MAEFALVSPTDIIDRYATNVDPTVQTKTGWRWLPVVVTRPAFNGDTQVQEGPIITVEAARVTRVWTVRAKTTGEIDTEKETRINDIDLVVFKILFDILKGNVAIPNAALTQAQFRAYVKSKL